MTALDAGGDVLRRALHAEGDEVMPAPDGPDRIRAGIESRHECGWWRRLLYALARLP